MTHRLVREDAQKKQGSTMADSESLFPSRTKIPSKNPLSRTFIQLGERNFALLLDWKDPAVIHYISRLLVDFTHIRNLYRIKDAGSRAVEDIAGMLLEGDPQFRAFTPQPEYEVKPHIGDFILFVAGIFPESVRHMRSSRRILRADALLDYVGVGREAYRAGAEFTYGPYGAKAPLLRKLPEHFELCLFALHQVRADLDRIQAVGFQRLRQRLWG
jgi:hypothetical protein